MIGLGGGRIPSGILMASMTDIRLSFRGDWGDARSVHFTPQRTSKSAVLRLFLAREDDGAGGRNRTDTPLGTAF